MLQEYAHRGAKSLSGSRFRTCCVHWFHTITLVLDSQDMEKQLKKYKQSQKTIIRVIEYGTTPGEILPHASTPNHVLPTNGLKLTES